MGPVIPTTAATRWENFAAGGHGTTQQISTTVDPPGSLFSPFLLYFAVAVAVSVPLPFYGPRRSFEDWLQV
jgi:hypothetical protein